MFLLIYCLLFLSLSVLQAPDATNTLCRLQTLWLWLNGVVFAGLRSLELLDGRSRDRKSEKHLHG